MKPKNRDSIYVVIREMAGARAAIIGSFKDPVEADDFKDATAAAWFDATKGAAATFSVCITTYYG